MSSSCLRGLISDLHVRANSMVRDGVEAVLLRWMLRELNTGPECLKIAMGAMIDMGSRFCRDFSGAYTSVSILHLVWSLWLLSAV